MVVQFVKESNSTPWLDTLTRTKHRRELGPLDLHQTVVSDKGQLAYWRKESLVCTANIECTEATRSPVQRTKNSLYIVFLLTSYPLASVSRKIKSKSEFDASTQSLQRHPQFPMHAIIVRAWDWQPPLQSSKRTRHKFLPICMKALVRPKGARACFSLETGVNGGEYRRSRPGNSA